MYSVRITFSFILDQFYAGTTKVIDNEGLHAKERNYFYKDVAWRNVHEIANHLKQVTLFKHPFSQK